MRKIVAGLMVSVDGVVEAPETWTGPYFSPELGQSRRVDHEPDGDTMLLGRVTSRPSPPLVRRGPAGTRWQPR